MRKQLFKTVVVGLAISLTTVGLSYAGEAKDAGAAADSEEFVWSTDADCSQCHELECASFEDGDTEAQAPETDGEPGASASTEAEGQDVAEGDSTVLAQLHPNQCTLCHTDEETLAQRHSKSNITPERAAKLKRLKKTEVETESCLACHGSWEELAEATEDSTVLTDEEGRVQNPHDLPDVSAHDKTTCYECHTIHREQDPDEQAQDYCLSCHHGNVYECYTCHG